MKTDPLAYKKATSVSLTGLAIQFVLAIVLLVYAVLGRDSIAATAFYYTLLGFPVWLSLALVFHQHRLERIESAEQEIYANATTEQMSVFEDAGADFRVAANRLAWMHRFLVPVISAATGAALIIVGLWRFGSGKGALLPDGLVRPPLTGWAVALGLGVAVVGFVFARFVSGMAKEHTWSSLRAGGATAVGVSLAGLALALAHGVAFAGSDIVLRYMHVILPSIMVMLGAEVFLNLLLHFYRPRQRGEVPRPAFDSRILGFVAAPDRIAESISDAINYQFGFNVSATWFYQLLSRSIASLVTLAALVIWLLTSLAVVRPNEKGLILQFGSFVRQVDSGLHLKAPWPIQTLERFTALSVNEITVGTPKPSGDEPILWTTAHGGVEHFTLVQSAADGDSRDLSLLAIEVPIQYEVGDLRAYRLLAADSEDPNDPEGMRRDLLGSVASRVLIEYAGSLSVDEILGGARRSMGGELRTRFQDAFDTLGPVDPESGDPIGSGVNIIFVGIAGAHPPREDDVALTFEDVVVAEQTGRSLIDIAEAGAISSLAEVAGNVTLARQIVDELDELERLRDTDADPVAIVEQEARIEALLADAGGRSATLILEAKAERWEKHMGVRGLATRQQGQTLLRTAAPAPYMAGLYFDTMLESVVDARVFITAFNQPHVRLNFEEIQSNISGFDIRNARE
jgi:regulator of protease activity HflC (stomatin/prohibitin superfamily)